MLLKITDSHIKYYYESVYERGCMKYIIGDKKSSQIDFDTAQKHIDYSLRTYDDYMNVYKN